MNSRPLLWLHPELHACETPFWRALADADGESLEPVEIPRGVRVLPLAGEAVVRAAELAEENPERFGAPRPVPVFVGACRAADGPVETRVAPTWVGLLPGDRYPPEVREATRRLIRTLHPERYLFFLMLEHYALAGVDLEEQAWTDLFKRAPDETERARPRIVAIEGIDGAGKSTHLAALREHLEGRGRRCASFKIFRHGLFHETVTDLTRLCADDKNLHLWRIQRLVKAFDSVKVFHAEVEPALEGCDVALFDRYVYTHLAAGTGRLHHDPYTTELLAVYPRPDAVFLLDLPEEEALARIGERAERTVDENAYMLGRYRKMLLGIAEREGFRVLDARAPFEENQAAIRASLDGSSVA